MGLATSRFSIAAVLLTTVFTSQSFAISDQPTLGTVCGGVDRRVPSQFPWDGRMLMTPDGKGGCSAALIGRSCMVTVAHCYGLTKFVEFNVPLSNELGIVHPPLEHLYEVDATTHRWGSNKAGDDWAVFRVRPNSITGLLPGEAQQGWYGLHATLDVAKGTILRVTGYGVDDETDRDKAQQSATGAFMRFETTTIPRFYHQVDTRSGNSGGGIVIESTRQLIGVHSGGECDTQGNIGTSLGLNAKFQAAVDECLAADVPVGSASGVRLY